ncbi:MAG TPA: molybdopterin converting factor subunit 1 [Verrucomicrobiae bacterium]|nr:molybdopterin converting factor subunit 1 [Verrucomicrobiae bacterium]
MRVRVLFFGMLKELTGKSAEFMDMPSGSTASALLERCVAEFPGVTQALSSVAIAVNEQYADPDMKLNENDEVALLPPVSGGAANAQDGSRASDLAGSKSGSSPEVRIAITSEPIRTAEIIESLKRGEDGASVVFEGIVRNQTGGRKTLFLDYEAYEEMALGQMQSLAAQAVREFPVREVAMVHRLGRLEIGETSVLIVVASAHRKAAFEACHWLIDTLKRTVPIWKKEHFEDGAVWADGEPFPPEIPRANSSGLGSPANGPASK